MELHASGDITLIAATLAHIRAELEDPAKLAALLDATVSTAWPTGEYDRSAMEFFRDRLKVGGPSAEGWYHWYAVHGPTVTSPRVLVGAAGYFGPPADGAVEIGFSVLPAWRRRGVATAIVPALVANAFSRADVETVVAHTSAANRASVVVLTRGGFLPIGPGRAPGTLRFERGRDRG